MEKKKESNVLIVIPAIRTKKFTLKLIGETTLIMHEFSSKSMKEMEDKQGQKATTAKGARNPEKEFIDSMYWVTGKPTEGTLAAFKKALKDGAKFGFPANGIKASALSAGHRCGITKNNVSMQGMFHIDGELVEIKAEDITMRKDPTRLNGKSTDLRYRGEFHNWTSEIEITYDADCISPEQIANLFNRGGFAVGIGDWRVEKGGQHGRYHVG
jgi:hypothetical protein